MRGKVTSVRSSQTRIVQTFGSGERRTLVAARRVTELHLLARQASCSSASSRWSDTDLELVDEDPKDPFDFSIDHWNDQLVAGYSKNTPNRGLKAHMPDYNDLKRRSVTN